MSESPAAPRRSQRDRKPTTSITTVTSATTGNRKRKRAATDTEDGGEQTSGPEDVTSPQNNNDPDAEPEEEPEEDEEEEYHGAKPKAPPAARKSRAKRTASKQKVSPPPAKKSRTAKAAPTRKGRKPKQATDGSFDPEQLAKDTHINGDNPLFNAIINPAAPLQGTAEDFLESLDQDAGTAQAELINLILRSCGCNDSVNADEALDQDGVVDALDNFTEGLKKDDSPTYPLTSKLPLFKKFRNHLSEFLSRLISSAADLGSLYTTDLILTLQTWVVAMSSSQIRSFRHTATVVALEIEAALCDVARVVEKEVEVVGRQREGEKKRRAKGVNNKDKGASARERELEQKSKEVNSRMAQLDGYIADFDDGVFIHRYRDLDAVIRTECITSLGLFFKKYPTHFLNNNYLRYVGWVLSDQSTAVRVAAVKSLLIVYASSSGEGDHILTALNHFTERFKPRLLEMAEGDIDVGVRVGVLGVLGEIDKAGLLEEDERERLGGLVFAEDTKVRKGVARFVKGVWEEWTEERIVEMSGSTALNGKGKKAKGKGKSDVDVDRDRVGIKGLASLLVKWGKALDDVIGDDDEEDEDVGDEGVGTSNGPKRSKHIAASAAATSHKSGAEGRTALAVEALWDELEPVSDWEGILDVLLLDHSASGEEQLSPSKARRGRGGANGKKTNTDQEDDDEDTELTQVDEAWRLEEIEEGILLEVLVASLRRTKKEAAAGKKGDDEGVADDITRALIKGLPRLFIKHQTDESRISVVLQLPTLMNLDLYLEMRMIPAYATLWDDVIKQLTTHTSPIVLALACGTIMFFMDTTSLSNTNSTKILELEDELSSSLRDTIAGREEIEIASFSGDEILSLTAFTGRLKVLIGVRDMTAWIEENEGGKQSSAWDILNALIERGRLGYKEEEAMVEQAIESLYTYLCWKTRGLTSNADPMPEELLYQETLITQRELLLEKLVEYAIGTQSNTVEAVKRIAFKHLLNIYLLFPSVQEVAADGSLLPTSAVPLSMDDEIQYRCAGYVQAEMERYADILADATGTGDDEEGSDEDDEDDDDTANAKKKKKADKSTKSGKEVDMNSRTHLSQEYIFLDVIGAFIRAVRAGVIQVGHGAVLLAQYGRLGSSFDLFAKYVVDILREEGTGNNNGEVVVSVVTQAVQEAFTLFIEGAVSDETNAHQLAKALASSFVLRGSHLAVVRRLESKHIVQIQLNSLTWICKRLAAYQTNGNKRSIKKCISFFRVLVPLLSSIQSRDALTIKAHLDQVLAQAKAEVSPTLKMWEPQRAYEKRLAAIMSKDKAPGTKGRKGKGAKAALFSDEEGEESEVEKIVDDDLNETPEPPPVDQRTPRARRARKPSPPADAVATPKPRPKPRAARAKNKSPPKQVRPSPENEPAPETNGFVTPKKTRKRPRSEVDDEEDVPNTADGSAAGDLSEPEHEPIGEMQIRRKRVRH